MPDNYVESCMSRFHVLGGINMTGNIRRPGFGACFVVLTTLLAGCGSGPRVITNADPQANFADFRTFSFMRPLSTDLTGATSIMGTHLIAATTNELEMLGMRHTNNDPDLLVNFFVSTSEVTRASSMATTGMSTHHRRGRYGTWGGYNVALSTGQMTQSTDGTLSVDIVDAARNQLVWEGAATARVTEARQDNLEETLHDAITRIFRNFP